MQFIVYFPDERQVIACDPDDFSSPDVTSLDDIDKLDGSIIVGVCFYDEKPYNNAILLQVKSKLRLIKRLYSSCCIYNVHVYSALQLLVELFVKASVITCVCILNSCFFSGHPGRKRRGFPEVPQAGNF